MENNLFAIFDLKYFENLPLENINIIKILSQNKINKLAIIINNNNQVPIQ